MIIFEKVVEIYQNYYICPHCLGRMFSLLATDTTNYERGYSILLTLTMENHSNFLSSSDYDKNDAIVILKLLAENAAFSPAIRALAREGLETNSEHLHKDCYLCNGIFSNLKPYVIAANEKVNALEFDSFLIGSSIESAIINREDAFKAKFNLIHAESFKTHFNRELGKQLSPVLTKPTDLKKPHVTIIFQLGFENFKIDLLIRSLFISGRYNKYIRGIPQTHWDCRICRGKGCEACNGTGKQYAESVEELINTEFLFSSKATDSKFHGAGREDIDVKMLGTGRPFVLELKNPKVRSLNLLKIQKKINRKHRKKIKIIDLSFSNKDKVKMLKINAENTRKTYRAIVRAETPLDKLNFNSLLNSLKHKLENQQIEQRTPNRVSHRRADKYRKKMVYSIQGYYLKSNKFEFIIDTQGGTYIKELINGDNGRTIPSFSDIFGINLQCDELDVLKIY